MTSMSSTLIEELAKYYTLGVAAKAMGVSRVTLWKRIKAGQLQGYRVGREVLIAKSDIESGKRKGV